MPFCIFCTSFLIQTIPDLRQPIIAPVGSSDTAGRLRPAIDLAHHSLGSTDRSIIIITTTAINDVATTCEGRLGEVPGEVAGGQLVP
eukprot:scaffold25634_cov40-Prasinocladus_malaysianus.AAC.1